MLRWRLLVLPIFCLLCGGAFAQQAAPLKLELAAESEVLFAVSRGLGRTAQPAQGWEIEPVRLTLKLINAGQVPLKFNLHDLEFSHLEMEVSGDHLSSVGYLYKEIFRNVPPIQATDLVTLPAGKSYTFPKSPFSHITGYQVYMLSGPGTYHMRVVYNNIRPANAPAVPGIDLTSGCWQGAVASNEVTLRVLEAGEAVNGLQMALETTSGRKPGEFTLTGHFRNVSDKPVTIPAWDVEYQGLQMPGPDGKPLPFSGGADRSRPLRPEERSVTLAPATKCAFPLSGFTFFDPPGGLIPTGKISVMNRNGFFRTWTFKEETCILQGSLTASEKVSTDPQPRWWGQVKSAPLTMQPDQTAHRAALLKQDLKTFSLSLGYDGPQDKPFYAVCLQTAPAQKDENSFSRVVQIDEKEAATLIDFLADNGFLRDAEIPRASTAVPKRLGYAMAIAGGLNAQADYFLNLGWDLTMIHRLEALQTGLPDKAKADMSLLLGRLSGVQGAWEAEAAKTKRLSLVLDNQPLKTAVELLNKAVATPSCPITLGNADQPGPALALQFADIPTQEICIILAQAAGYACDVRNRGITLNLLEK